jgi:threonine synthase
MHIMAKMDGVSMESAAATAFAGLFRMVADGQIRPEDVIVVNCSGHTFPVEKFLLGDGWQRSVRVDQEGNVALDVQEEGLLASLENLDRHVGRIAIIEDDPDSARLLRRVLQAQGEYEIDEAHDGQIGLEMVRENVPDLILLDLMMPDFDGFALIDALKAEERLCNIPVIVVTAKELTTHERQRLAGNVQRLWRKGTFLNTDLAEDIEGILT